MSALVNPALGTPSAPSETPSRTAGDRQTPSAAGGRPFSAVLREAAGRSGAPPTESAVGLQFSRHALQRVQRRGIELDGATLTRLREGIGRAAGKGSRDSVVLVDGTAFVVSVSNRTVVTAVGSEHMREHVFTNIDSAVIA